MHTASLLIRTKNEEKGLGPTLDGVFGQDPPPHEVLVIDSGSTDRTLEIAARYPVRILHIAPRDWGYSRALNLGGENATGEILVCLSAHCVPIGSDWLRRLLAHFDDPAVAAVWGPGVPPGDPVPASAPPTRQEPGSYTAGNSRWGMSNQNSALRRELWAEFPFDESLPATEDKAWAREAMARGYSIVHDPNAGVWHERHPPVRAFRRNQAVTQGYKLLFPEFEQPAPLPRRIARGTWRELRRVTRKGGLSRLRTDLRALPSKLSGVLGDRRGSR